MSNNFRYNKIFGHLGSDQCYVQAAWFNLMSSYLVSTLPDCFTRALHPLHPPHLHSRHHCTSSSYYRGKNCQNYIFLSNFLNLDLVQSPTSSSPSRTLPDSLIYCHVPIYYLPQPPRDTCPSLYPGQGTIFKVSLNINFDNAVNDASSLVPDFSVPPPPSPETGVDIRQGNIISYMYLVFNHIIQISLTLIFPAVSSISMTMSVNVYMKSYNDNIKTPYFDFLH